MNSVQYMDNAKGFSWIDSSGSIHVERDAPRNRWSYYRRELMGFLFDLWGAVAGSNIIGWPFAQ